MQPPPAKTFLKSIGPGLLWAGAAIGVSHLVQSTRAGANYGFMMIWFLLLANFLKYPFFQFAPRYATATGKNLLQGYQQLGRWAPVMFFIFALGTIFTIQGAVTLVTTGLIAMLLGTTISVPLLAAILLSICMVIILVGRYALLDQLMKVIIVLLAVTTVMAVVMIMGKGYHPDPLLMRTFRWTDADVLFLIAFFGWMPSTIDMSTWHSMWAIEKVKLTGYRPTLKESYLDFNIGYFGTVFFAICFLLLGTYVMYGGGQEFSESSVAFAGQLVKLFTAAIGEWAFYVIAVAALTTMFSTTVTCLDAIPRVMKASTEIIFPQLKGGRTMFIVWLFLLAGGAMVVIVYFSSRMKVLIDVATTLSFVAGPVFAFLNYKVVMHKTMPDTGRPSRLMKVYSWLALAGLTTFTVYFLIVKFG